MITNPLQEVCRKKVAGYEFRVTGCIIGQNRDEIGFCPDEIK